MSISYWKIYEHDLLELSENCFPCHELLGLTCIYPTAGDTVSVMTKGKFVSWITTTILCLIETEMLRSGLCKLWPCYL